MSNWKLTVGMEVHVELETKTKMFCGCKNDPFNSAPNTNVCPVCYGLPGSLPLLNKEAIAMTIRLGQALKGKIPEKTFWARKNYFYPDLPKGYQISQSSAPIVSHATVTIDGKDHHLERIHLEEDAGKMLHSKDKTQSFVDYNRAGVPLMEIVTEPDFNSAEEAKRFCQELQRIMRSLKISSADMEKGQMRCEANISVSKTDQFGTKVEVKNINSFRSVEKAINYEFDRQVKLIETGEKVIHETRTWKDDKGETVPMRTKETAADYRYFPEPDLPIVELSLEDNEEHLLPDEQRQKLTDLGVPSETARILVDKGLFNQLIEHSYENIVQLAKLFVDLPRFAELSIEDQGEFITMQKDKGWTKETSNLIIDHALNGKLKIAEAAEGFSFDQDLGELTKEVMAEHASAVEQYRSGKEGALNFLVGQVMAKTKGRANIQQVREQLLKELSDS